MTVDSKYNTVTVYENDGGAEYPYPYESIGLEAVDLYTVDANGASTQLTKGVDYLVKFSEYRENTPYRGRIRLQSPVPASSKLRVERKTPITQTIDFAGKELLDPNQIEYALDKICFIEQEIEGHFCDCRGPVYPIGTTDPINGVINPPAVAPPGTEPPAPQIITQFEYAERVSWAASGRPVTGDGSSYVWGESWDTQYTQAESRAVRNALNPATSAAATIDQNWFNEIGYASAFKTPAFYSDAPSTAIQDRLGPNTFYEQDAFIVRQGFYAHTRVNLLFCFEPLPATLLGGGVPTFNCDLVSPLEINGKGYGLQTFNPRGLGAWTRIPIGSISTYPADFQAAYQTVNNCPDPELGFTNPTTTPQIFEKVWAGFKAPSAITSVQQIGTFRTIRMPHFHKDDEFTIVGVGPVIRDDDDRYNDQAFWEAALANAIAKHSNNLPATWVGENPAVYAGGSDPNNFSSWVYGVDYPVTVVVDGTEPPDKAVYQTTRFAE